MSEQVKPIQKILFGSPGTGKSYQVREIAKNELNIPFDEDTKMLRNTITANTDQTRHKRS